MLTVSKTRSTSAIVSDADIAGGTSCAVRIAALPTPIRPCRKRTRQIGNRDRHFVWRQALDQIRETRDLLEATSDGGHCQDVAANSASNMDTRNVDSVHAATHHCTIRTHVIAQGVMS